MPPRKGTTAGKRFARQPRPDEVVRFGHIATAVRAAMEARGWQIAVFNEAAGFSRGATQMYQIMNARCAPSPRWRDALHKLLEIPLGELRERPLVQSEEAAQVIQAQQKALPGPAPRAQAVGDVLQFAINSEGNARLRLDVVLPVREALPVLRILLDQGFVVRDVVEEEA